MNKNRGINLWNFRYKIVSGLLTAMLVFACLAVLLPLSSRVVEGYSMPSDVKWNMDDLVANSSGAVTMGTPDLYYVHEDIFISLNSTLVVSPGEKVYFDLGTGFQVYGYLSASGNNMSMITFTSNVPPPQSYGDWDGISFHNGSDGTIQYVKVSYAETGILINNTMVSPIVNSEFKYNVWGVRIINAYCFVSHNTFKFNGILPHPDPYYSVGGGVYLENDSYGSVSNNDFTSNIGGVRVEGSSYLYIMNNILYNNSVYGIYCTGDYYRQPYTNIMNNEITHNQYYGVYADGNSGIFVDTNNITNNNVGIRFGGATGTTGGWGSILNNYIAYNLENGIECFGGTGPDPGGNAAYISGNEIVSNSLAGIYCQDSSPNIENNQFISNQFGVYAYNSSPLIKNSYFESNDNAIWANLSNVKVTDSAIVKSLSIDLYLENDAYITSLNTTFNDYAVHFDDYLSVLEVQWYLHILVINATGPVPSADVTVSDNANGTWIETFKANAQGRVLWIVVTEYIRDLSTWVYYTPHNITASKGSEIGYAEPLMDISKLVILNISPGPPAPQPPLPPLDLSIILLGSDLELTWGPSPDDGGGANDVKGYVIYRAPSVNGPYVNVSFVSSGLSTYSWVDSGKGDLDWNKYFYIVRAKDMDNLEDSNENKVGKFVSNLVEGWNMVSVPLIQSNTSREAVLQTLGSNYATVQGYHAGKSRPWLHWHRGKPNYFNDVIEMDNGGGYYIDMYVADHLVTVGKVSSQEQISLKSGWNLVGNPCLTNKLRDDALSSISGKYNMVERFDTVKDREVRLGSGDNMQPGLAYWIHATQNCIWTITN